ncbi:H-NS histone family protein [Paraburkholderia mimosarum]|uniref:H-NS histone family protein n=1 Tax=Paraburkholderia mimosarum TaxID=312026 RepID=UPI00040160BF|nr:H-NS histone family protein [Paraburkholderia mimosarum]
MLAEKRELDARVEALEGAERSQALATIRELMTQFDIGIDEILVRRGPKKPGVAPVKYRDPESGATWSGRGREPRWIDCRNGEAFAVQSRRSEPGADRHVVTSLRSTA